MKNELKPLKIINNFYEIREIAQGVYDIDEARLATMYLIIGNERALVIDCGIGIGDFKAVIRELTDLPYDVVMSHAHVDHIGGRGQFEKFFIHKADIEIIPKVTYRYRKVFKTFVIQNKKRFLKSTLIKVEKEPEAIAIEDGHIFNLGSKTVKVILSSGHTLGSLSFLIEEDKILLTTDNFNPLLYLFLPHSDTVENYVKSGEKILAYKDMNIYWGSHLSKPISYDIMKTTIENAKMILVKYKNNSKRYHFRIFKRNKSTIAFRTDNIFNK